MKKGIILAGGKGTRLYPLTEVTSKQLLPVYDKPMIYYPLCVLIQAGIEDILIVSSPGDLPRFTALLKDGSQFGLNISYQVQDEPLGIAHALLISEKFICEEPIALILGDNLFYGSELPQFLEVAIEQHHGATIFGYPVSNPCRYGVAEFDDFGEIQTIHEKPKSPPSKYAITGLYFYDEHVINYAKQLTPSQRGEYEITDLNNLYLENGRLSFMKFSEGFAWLDSGNIDELYKASQYVKFVQEMHNTKIGSVEKIAYEKGLISLNQLEILAKQFAASEYGKFLLSFAAEQRENLQTVFT